ncbi:transcriptional regulator, partial [Halobacteriales archaeon QS_7_68_65]
MSSKESPLDEAYSALDRLYDDPEARIADLRDTRQPKGDVAGREAVFKALANEDRLRVLETLR